MTAAASTYLMDHPREASRLAEKVNAPAWVEQYLAQYVTPTAAVLDVGCGPGVLAAEVSRQFPAATVTGLDVSQDRLHDATMRLSGFQKAAVRQGDATALPFPDETFDIVYCRLLLQYLPDRGQAVREMARVCRRGGRVLLQDLDGQLLWHEPEDDELQRLLGLALAGLSRSGFDPYVGRKLFSLARTAGLRDLRVQAESYHLIAGRIDERSYGQWKLKLDIAYHSVAQAIGETKAARLRELFLAYLQREDTLTYSVVFTVTGVRPA